MGEKSKFNGEFGESLVSEFLKLIGWSPNQTGVSLPCVLKERHSYEEKGVVKQRVTHGIDFIYHYKCPLQDNMLKIVCLSSKFTEAKYPNSPNRTFKEYLTDIIQAIDCFKKDEKKSIIQRQYSDVNKTEEIGVIIWLSNDINTYDDVASKLINIELNKDDFFRIVYLVDNQRIDFLFQMLHYLKGKYPEPLYEIYFEYLKTGKNINPLTYKAYGKTLPVEYINAPIVLLRVVGKDETFFVIISRNQFDESDLVRLVSLIQNTERELSTKVIIGFPDYDPLNHEKQVKDAFARFESIKTEKISVISFNPNFRNIKQ